MDPSQIILLGEGASCGLEHVSCRGQGCLTTMHLDPGSLAELARRLEIRPSHWNLPDVAILSEIPELAYPVHVLLSVTRRGSPASSTSPKVVGSVVRHLFTIALSRATSPGPRAPRSSLGLSELARRARGVLIHQAGGISLKAMADGLGRSEAHVCRVFKAETGMTTRQYLQRLRISEALYRLGEGEEDLLELALDLGYSSHSHFTSVFRRLVGLPPSRVWARVEESKRRDPEELSDVLDDELRSWVR